ncbi:MAG TPA: hypothetical protein PKD55_12305 [Bellilinea sp.]|nr:hypothetical protein [Bellilinea sp.]
MNLSFARPSKPISMAKFPVIRPKPSSAFLLILISALIGFELFNFSTTDYALRDLLGDLTFFEYRWSTILALAFCGIDFAGIGKLFGGKAQQRETRESWYLFAAWLLAAAMNAMLTWWGVALAISDHVVKSSAVLDTRTITVMVPLFVAVMVWLIRILVIGSLSAAAEAITTSERVQPEKPVIRRDNVPAKPAGTPILNRMNPITPNTLRSNAQLHNRSPRTEPTYHSLRGNQNSSVNGSGTFNSSGR